MCKTMLCLLAVGLGEGSVIWLAGLSAFQSGSGGPQATEGGEQWWRLEGVDGVMSWGLSRLHWKGLLIRRYMIPPRYPHCFP